jgi:LCP family protein required for cell wall assembly
MPSEQEARPRVRSPFAAAVLSLLFPGLGHAYAGAFDRALAFAAAPLLLLALAAGVVVRLDRFQLAGLAVQAWFLTAVFVGNLVLLVYRLIAIVDAWRVTQFLNAWDAGAGGARRPATPQPGPVAVAGVLAVVLVMTGSHVAVARYDLLATSLADCVFTAESARCPEPSGSLAPTLAPDPSASTEPTLALPPEGSPLPNATVPPWNGKDRLNILLIGTDQRPREATYNTDTLIVVSIDPATRRVAMFSLPRDTVDVPVPAGPARTAFGAVYTRKINSFFSAVRNRADLFPGTAATRGYNGLKAILGELYGLQIQYFVEVNFDGFRRVVDALGGVTINVQVPVVDDVFPDDTGALQRIYIPAGMRHMSGTEALIYARSRHGSNDFDRGQRQQRILVALRDQADISAMLPRIDELAQAVGQSLRTDVPREVVPQMLGLAASIDARSIRSYVFAPPVYQTENPDSPRGYIVQPKVSVIRSTVKNAFVADIALETTREALATEGARIWVLRGSTRGGDPADIADYLEYLGMTASAPTGRGETTTGTKTRIVVYNGAEARLTETIRVLESLFGVTSSTATDAAGLTDIIVTTGAETPTLTPPPAP